MMLPARRLPDAVPTISGPIGKTTRRGQAAATAPAVPVVLDGLPVVVLEGRRVCGWRDCTRPAVVRITFTLPSLLAGETRDYCRKDAGRVAGQPGAVVAARLAIVRAEGTH